MSLSKINTPEDKERLLQGLCRHATLNVLVVCTNLQSEVTLVNKLYKGDAAAGAQFLSRTAALAGLTEFLLNPSVGRLSDTLGRKRFLMLGASFAAIGNALVAINPNSLSLIAVNRFLCWSLLTVSGSVTGSAALSDIFEGKDLGNAIGRYFGAFGIGVVLGPAIGMVVERLTGSLRAVYAARSLLAVAEVVHDYYYVEETLPPEKRRPASELTYVSPFGFVNMLSRASAESPTLLKLILSAWLVCFSEGKNVTNIAAVFQDHFLGMTSSESSLFSIAYGLMMFVGGAKIQPKLVKALGPRGFTSFTLLLSATYFGICAASPAKTKSYLAAAMILGFPSFNATGANVLKAKATDHAVAMGYGRGEYAGLFNNLRALSVATAPLLYGEMYAYFIRKKIPVGQVWTFIALISAVIPEAIHRMALTNADFGIKE